MGLEVSRSPTSAPNSTSEKPATVVAKTLEAPSSGHVTLSRIESTSTSVCISGPEDMQQVSDATAKTTPLARVLDSVRLESFNVVDTTPASSTELISQNFDSATNTCQETNCSRQDYVQDPTLQGFPCTSENKAVVATMSGLSRNQVLSIQNKLSAIPREQYAFRKLPANNSLDSISSLIIPEPFEALESTSLTIQQQLAKIPFNVTQRRITAAPFMENSLSPGNNTAVSSVTFTDSIPSILRYDAQSNLGNGGATYTSKIKHAQIPIAVTYADATNLAAQYPDLASQILVSPLRKRTASEEVSLTPDQDSADESPPSKRRRPRNRRQRRRRSRDKSEVSQQRGDRIPVTPACPSSQKGMSFASGSSRAVDLQATSRSHYTPVSERPYRSVDPASPTSCLSLDRAPSLQTNRHAANAASQIREETTRCHQQDRDADWGAFAATMRPTTGASNEVPTPFPTRLATPQQTPSQDQHDCCLSLNEKRVSFIKATDSAMTPRQRRSSNADLILTELFRKAMDTGSPPATVRYPEHSSLRKYAEGLNTTKEVVPETTHSVNQAENIFEGDSPRVKLPAPLAPPMVAPAKVPQHKPATARPQADYPMYQSYKPPHQRVNQKNHNAATMHNPSMHHASPLKRNSNPRAPPSPRVTELLERTERIRHLERVLARERDLPIEITRLAAPSLKQGQVLQPIGPWQASEERAFHQRGAMDLKTNMNQNQSLNLVRAMQSMGLGISSIGTDNSAVEQSQTNFNGMQQRPSTKG